MQVCIVIPVYNEEKIIQESLDTIISYVSKLPGFLITLINDGSTDKTREILNGFNENPLIRVIDHKNNAGYGSALRSGLRYAIENNYDYALFMDSDLTNHPRYLEKFFDKIRGGCEYIKASRYARGGAVCGVPVCHRLVSWCGNKLAGLLFGLPLSDYTNGFRAVKVNLLARMTLREPGFAIIMEELFKAKHLTKSFCEIPYTLTSRKPGQGATRFSYNAKTCMVYLKYALKSFFRCSPIE